MTGVKRGGLVQRALVLGNCHVLVESVSDTNVMLTSGLMISIRETRCKVQRSFDVLASRTFHPASNKIGGTVPQKI